VEKKVHWKNWRKVDLTVNGVIVLQVMGRGIKD
jgi:hypothetical protein